MTSRRLHGLDFTRGLACLSMPIYHTVYNLYALGLIDTRWASHPFWKVYQIMGMSTFILVSGMAFTLSTNKGIRWSRLLRRAAKLAAIAALISLATYIIAPQTFVRFGILHFFAMTIFLAPLIRIVKHWAIVPGLAIIISGIIVTKAGLYSEPWLYITGLMSDRPRSMDYVPLIPWFGIFMLGMGLAQFLPVKTHDKHPNSYMRPVIWLGKNSLPFYIIHQLVVYATLWLIAYLL